MRSNTEDRNENTKFSKTGKKMRLKQKSTKHLYSSFLKQKGGSFPVYKGRLGRSRQGGGFFAFKMLKNLGKSFLKAIPKIGKGVIRDVGPALLDSLAHQGKSVLSGQKKLKQGFKDLASKQLAQQLLKATKAHTKKQMGRGGLKNTKKRKKMKVIGKSQRDVFSTLKF